MGNNWAESVHHPEARQGSIWSVMFGGRRQGSVFMTIRPFAAVPNLDFFVIDEPLAGFVGMGQYCIPPTYPWEMKKTERLEIYGPGN